MLRGVGLAVAIQYACVQKKSCCGASNPISGDSFAFPSQVPVTGRNGAYPIEIGLVLVLHRTSEKHCQIRSQNVLFLHISLVVFY
jgi:hypothetical protein